MAKNGANPDEMEEQSMEQWLPPGNNAESAFLMPGGGGDRIEKTIKEHNFYPVDPSTSFGKTCISEREILSQVRQSIKFRMFSDQSFDTSLVHWHRNALYRSKDGWATNMLVKILQAASGGQFRKKFGMGNGGGGMGGYLDRSQDMQKSDVIRTE